MKRKLILTLAVEVADWSPHERAEEAQRQGCKLNDIPRLREVTPFDLAELITGAIENASDMWGGSEIYAEVKSVKPLAYNFQR